MIQNSEQLVFFFADHPCRIAEQHKAVGSTVLFPFRQIAAVGIACYNKVLPVAEHLSAQLSVTIVVQVGILRNVAVAVDLFTAVPVAQPSVLLRKEIFINGDLFSTASLFRQ